MGCLDVDTMLSRMEPADFDERFAVNVLDEREAEEIRNRLAAILKKGFAPVCLCLGREVQPDAFEPERVRAASISTGRGSPVGPQQDAVASPNQAAAMMSMIAGPPTG